MCGDGDCIDSSRVCDQLPDCTDRSDAQNCSRDLTSVVYLQPSDIPRQCPDANDVPTVCGNSTCSRDADCRDGQACCNSGCDELSFSCTTAIPVRPVCRSLARQRRQDGLLGAFVPSCEEDGSFSEQQCRAGFCWCVDVATGQPVSSGSRSSVSCTRCTTENGTMPVGISFSSSDGCNTWY